MLSRVCIAGYGITKFTQHTNLSLESVLLHSVKNLFDNTPQCERNDIDAVLVANAAGGYQPTQSPNISSKTKDDNKTKHTIKGGKDTTKHITKQKHNNNLQKKGSGYMATILAELAGIRPKVAHTVESLCSSGTSAIVSGYAYVASGLADVVLISGAEIYDSPGRILWWDDSRGQFKHPVFWASLFTSRYKRLYNISDEDLAIIPARAYANAQYNPDGLQSSPHTINDVINSRYITGDLRVLDCSRPCTGGASIILASERAYHKYTDTPIWITGIGQKVTSAGFAKSFDNTYLESARQATHDALHMASSHNNLLEISDIQVAEIHDAFSVCEPMILEALGMSELGKGIQVSRELYNTENKMINPRGGLIGAGHPLGATGIAQSIEIVKQLRSEAHGRQIDAPHNGMVHNMSAAGTSSIVMVMQR